MNPLNGRSSPKPQDSENSYLLQRSSKNITPSTQNGGKNPAVDMLRRKIDALFEDETREPDAQKQAEQVQNPQEPRSRHQEVMYRLTVSGKSMAEIQTAWHEYYAKLSDAEKHEVWQEFYSANARNRRQKQTTEQKPTKIGEAPSAQDQASQTSAEQTAKPGKPVVSIHEEHEPAPQEEYRPEKYRPTPATASKKTKRRATAGIRRKILGNVRATSKAESKAKQRLKSLVFGLSLGALALLITMFGLFNELVITPFIRPGNAAATPIILNADAPAPSNNPEVIIPKLNAQLPVVYGSDSVVEEDVQKALEKGVFHYPTTATPGQDGNVAIFGHSSNNIFSRGDYKFAFVLLRELEPGDIFHLTYEGKVYTYKVYNKKVVTPDETWVLNPVEGKRATATLITCDPPGSIKHRLVVWAEQISPSPSDNAPAAEPSEEIKQYDLPGKAPSFWERIREWVSW